MERGRLQFRVIQTPGNLLRGLNLGVEGRPGEELGERPGLAGADQPQEALPSILLVLRPASFLITQTGAAPIGKPDPIVRSVSLVTGAKGTTEFLQRPTASTPQPSISQSAGTP